MLIERRAVEVDQAVRVVREVRRHPVENHAKTGFVCAVDELGELLGFAEARRRRKLPQRLVTPRAAKRMLGDRHEFDVRKSHALRVGDQAVGQLGPVETAMAFLRDAQPGLGVHFVDGDRRARRLIGTARLDPGVVGPRKLLDLVHMRDDRRGSGRPLGLHGTGVGLQRQRMTVAGQQFVFVARARADAGHEQLPHAGLMTQAHRMPASVPRIEVTDHRDAPRIRRPHGKAHAGHAIELHWARAETFEHRVRIAVSQPVQGFIAQHGTERIGILDFLHVAMPVDAQPVRRGRVDAADEQPVRMDLLQLAEGRTIGARNHGDVRGIRQQRAYFYTRVALMHAQLRKRIGMACLD